MLSTSKDSNERLDRKFNDRLQTSASCPDGGSETSDGGNDKQQRGSQEVEKTSGRRSAKKRTRTITLTSIENGPDTMLSHHLKHEPRPRSGLLPDRDCWRKVKIKTGWQSQERKEANL